MAMLGWVSKESSSKKMEIDTRGYISIVLHYNISLLRYEHLIKQKAVAMQTLQLLQDALQRSRKGPALAIQGILP
jgi:hypothetical protein